MVVIETMLFVQLYDRIEVSKTEGGEKRIP